MLKPDERSAQIAAGVIIHAGNARAFTYEALNAAERGEFTTAEAKLIQADKEITNGHQTQTELIQAEARGEGLQLSLLLLHAQDTLMVAMSEILLARHIMELAKQLHRKN